MKNCNKCHHENPNDAKFCEKCGAQLGSSKNAFIISAIVLVLLLIGGIYYVKTHLGHVESEPLPVSVSNPNDSLTAPANVLQSIRDKGVMRVAVESDAEPFNWIDKETNEEKGFECDLIKLVAKEMGINSVQLVWTSDYAAIPEMISKQNNQADIFMGGYIANPNITDVVWSDPYYQSGYCLVVPAGSAIKNLSDLTGKKIGIYNEDEAEKFVKENVQSPAAINRYDDEKHEGEDWMMIHLVESYAKKFNEDLVDAAIYDYPFAKVVVNKSAGQLNIVEFNLNKFDYQIGLPKNNYDLRTSLNAALKKVMDSPAYKDLVIKYLNFKFNTNLSDVKGVKIHTVAKGETLGSIAVKYYNDQKYWTNIWEANKNRIPDYNLIVVGDKLIIPNK